MTKSRDYAAMAERALKARPGEKRLADDDALPGDPPAPPSTLRPLTPDEQEAVDWYLRKAHPDWTWPDKEETK